MPTTASSPAALAGVSDLLERYDWRTIDQVCSDAEAGNYRPPAGPDHDPPGRSP